MSQFHEEYISAYLDDSLDIATKLEVERRLSTDAMLDAEYRSLKAVKRVITSRQDHLRLVAPIDVRRSVLLKLEQEMVRSASLASIQERETMREQPFAPIAFKHSNKHQRALQPHTSANANTSATVYTLPQLTRNLWENRKYLVAAMVVFVLGFAGLRVLIRSVETSTNQKIRQFAESATGATLISQSTLLREALSNHDAVTSGKLTLQYATSSFDDLDQFFRKNGITFRLVDPRIADAKLLGGVVSEENGKKSAHLVFLHNKTLLYMWEIEETPATITHVGIAPKAWQILQTGEWIWDTSTSKAATVVFWEAEDEKPHRTLCAVVAAMPREELQPLFR
jgi:anti-sigma factor RsiW